MLPDRLALGPAYPRNEPSLVQQRGAVLALAAQRPWAALDWSGLVEGLIALGRTDVPLARLTEGHVDALRIHREAGTVPVPESCYGVWASRSHGTGIRGTRDGDDWLLDGTLRFASGAGLLDRALIPVWVDPEHQVLLDVPVQDWPFVDDWRTRAMELSRSFSATLSQQRSCGRQIGEVDFYLDRRGFFLGGIGVAAVWTGGAGRVRDLVLRALPGEHRTPAQTVRLGAVRAELATAAAMCRSVAACLDRSLPGDGRTVATECRVGVAGAVRRLLEQARVAVGPSGLAYDEDLTRAVDDLALYVAQQNQDGDAAYLGGLA
ncbi:MAG: acyl-CoA dehydrogenase [Actinomycetota bacterium]|nr:acyl-CoA dehydrogenase [Actinomycetota bacterium]